MSGHSGRCFRARRRTRARKERQAKALETVARVSGTTIMRGPDRREGFGQMPEVIKHSMIAMAMGDSLFRSTAAAYRAAMGAPMLAAMQHRRGGKRGA